jgi:hypothetical protein
MVIAKDLATVLVAARALNDAVRHDEALALLDSIVVDDDRDRLAVLIATAEVAARRDWLRGRRSGADDPLDVALAFAKRISADEVAVWDLAMLRLRREYADALVHRDGTPWLGPEGREPDALEELTERARLLHETAPDAGRRGWAVMSRGWIADNLVSNRDAPPAYYAEALVLGREVGDWKLVFDAQRHLGDHLHDDGDLEAVRAAWEQSAHAAARAGHVTGVLAQQVLLVGLAREAGNEGGAVLLATETRRWAEAIGATRLVDEVDSFLSET